MRNIVKYPITELEIRIVLDSIVEDENSNPTNGGVNGFIKNRIKEYLCSNEIRMESLIEFMKIEPPRKSSKL